MAIFTIPDQLKINNRKMRWLLYTLFGLMAADGLITKYLVLNGYASEANPFLQSWVNGELFLALKISGAFIITLFLWIKYNSKPDFMFSVTTIFVTFYTVVVFWNLFVFYLPVQ